MLGQAREHRMADISSVASSAIAAVSQQTAALGRAVSATTTSFGSVLAKVVPPSLGGRPATGFIAGPTYEATTLSGQTKAAFNNSLNTTKSVLGIKP
jgi:hypothetical protein